MTEFPDIAVPPDLFASAWTIVSKNAATAKDSIYHNVIAIEAMREGIWLASFSAAVIVGAWVPYDPYDIDRIPDFRRDSDAQILVRDTNGVLGARANQLAKHWKAAQGAPGIADNVHVTAEAKPTEDGQLPGLSGGSVRFRDPSWHVDVDVPEISWFPWRTMLDLVPSTRTEIMLLAPVGKFVALLKDHEVPQIEFSGNKGILRAGPKVVGTTPVFACVAIGTAPLIDKPDDSKMDKLTPQVYEDGEYHDDEDDEDEAYSVHVFSVDGDSDTPDLADIFGSLGDEEGVR